MSGKEPGVTGAIVEHIIGVGKEKLFCFYHAVKRSVRTINYVFAGPTCIGVFQDYNYSPTICSCFCR